MGWIILGAFVFLVASHGVVFFAGYKTGHKAATAEFDGDLRRKAQNEIEFHRAKNEIRQEVFGDAETKKASLSHGDSRERYNRTNDILRGKPAS